jgi:hypothetical protein
MFNFFKNKNEVDLYNLCDSEYNNDWQLKTIREYVKQNSYGFVDDAHYTMWREIVKELPTNFTFLEIGVFKGQILNLITFLSKKYKKNAKIYGVSPLSDAGDKYSTYDKVDYSTLIENLFAKFDLPFDLDKQIIRGLSTDDFIKNKIKEIGPIDLLYVDGGHDYDTVVSDILLAKEIISNNGIIVFDDASCYKNLGNLPFKGHIEVCNAIRDFMENDKNYTEIACVGHNRFFIKNI